MPRNFNLLLVLVIIALFITKNSLGRLLEGSTGIINGFLTWTNTKKPVDAESCVEKLLLYLRILVWELL
jgi:hypothetical protein